MGKHRLWCDYPYKIAADLAKDGKKEKGRGRVYTQIWVYQDGRSRQIQVTISLTIKVAADLAA